MTITVTYVVNDQNWSISRDGVQHDTIRGHYDADQVLLEAQRHADGRIAWVVQPDGNYQSVTLNSDGTWTA